MKHDRSNAQALPVERRVYYGGAWHDPASGAYADTLNPGTGESLGRVAVSNGQDVDGAVGAAKRGFLQWRDVAPLERARLLKALAALVREHADELAMIDAANCGNPVREMAGDARIAAAQLGFFAGLVTEMKGTSIPMGRDAVDFSIREPLGVVARIIPFNHPFMFCAGKAAAPLAAGNAVVIKPPEQAPLSSLRLAELADTLLPPGVFNVVPGGREAGAALAAHPGVAKVALIGSVAAGRAVMRAASDTVKPLLLELGGKNALIAYPDTDVEKVAAAIVAGMNFTWCGQSCGSTSRAFVHASIYDPRSSARRSAIALSSSLPQQKAKGLVWSAVARRRVIRLWKTVSISSRRCSRTSHPTCASPAKRFSVPCSRFCAGTMRLRCWRR